MSATVNPESEDDLGNVDQLCFKMGWLKQLEKGKASSKKEDPEPEMALPPYRGMRQCSGCNNVMVCASLQFSKFSMICCISQFHAMWFYSEARWILDHPESARHQPPAGACQQSSGHGLQGWLLCHEDP